jgi:hypothetical protein
MEPYKHHFFWHCREVYAAAPKFDAEVSVNLRNFVLTISKGERRFQLYPQFMVRDASGVRYATRPDQGTRFFAGWLPYFNKRFPAGAGKFAFKDFCAANGLPTPPTWRAPAPDMRDFLVKHDDSSFGRGLRGPFVSYRADDPAQAMRKNGYFEKFVRGRVLKTWYWEDRLVSLEFEDMPTIRGDGRLPARELIVRKLPFKVMKPNWTMHEDVLAYQGLTLNSVVPEGREVLADISYNSLLQPLHFGNSSVLSQFAEHPVVRRLRSFGPVFWQAVPEALRPATLYTVDGIADERDEVWLLEMNCNPSVHPDAYPHIFERLLGAAEQPSDAALPPWPRHRPGSFRPSGGLKYWRVS